MARVGDRYSVPCWMPRRSWHSFMTAPIDSVGTMKLTRTIGCRNSSISPASGTSCGRWISSSSPALVVDLVGHVRRRLHQVDVRFLLQTLLDDFHVQQAEEAAAKSEAQRLAGLRLELETGIVDRQSFQRFTQFGKVLAVGRIESAVDHPLRLLVAGQRLARPVRRGRVTVSPMCTRSSDLMLQIR